MIGLIQHISRGNIGLNRSRFGEIAVERSRGLSRGKSQAVGHESAAIGAVIRSHISRARCPLCIKLIVCILQSGYKRLRRDLISDVICRRIICRLLVRCSVIRMTRQIRFAGTVCPGDILQTFPRKHRQVLCSCYRVLGFRVAAVLRPIDQLCIKIGQLGNSG